MPEAGLKKTRRPDVIGVVRRPPRLSANRNTHVAPRMTNKKAAPVAE
jgi:hypothetical protein